MVTKQPAGAAMSSGDPDGSATTAASAVSFASLPEDMQDQLWPIFEEVGLEPPEWLPVRRLRLSALPDDYPLPEVDVDGRGLHHARGMPSVDQLPPIVVSTDLWLDGRHRVWRARADGAETIAAIDLAGWDIRPDEVMNPVAPFERTGAFEDEGQSSTLRL